MVNFSSLIQSKLLLIEMKNRNFVFEIVIFIKLYKGHFYFEKLIN